jgi:hypothetical protein
MESATLLFALGQIVATRNADSMITWDDIWPTLARHGNAD